MKFDRWFVTKAALVATVLAYIAGSWWFTRLLTTKRPKVASDEFVVPFKQHGGLTYVTPFEHWAHLGMIAVGVVLVLAWWLVEHFEKRSRTR